MWIHKSIVFAFAIIGTICQVINCRVPELNYESTHRHFDLTNVHHRSNPTLRFDIRGDTVASETGDASPQVQFHLTDKSIIDVEQLKSAHANVSEYRFVWKNAGPSLDKEVCFHYGFQNASWFSTYEERIQHWPLDTQHVVKKGTSFTTADYFQQEPGDIIEHLFINSDGFGIMLDEHHPWFIRRDPSGDSPVLCFALSDASPYPKLTSYDNGYFDLAFTVKSARNIKELYLAFTKGPGPSVIPKPLAIPDERVFRYPIWSTWAEYKKNIDEKSVMEYAEHLKHYGFPNAQLEIDEQWQPHFGDFQFDTHKFPDVKKMISKLHEQGFRVTAWIQHFVNKDSTNHETEKARFLKDHTGAPIKVKWWEGEGSVFDFSDPATAQWYVEQLRKLQNETGLDGYKFDAGELTYFHAADYVPHDPRARQYPNLLTKKYVETVAQIGRSLEVRTGFKTQHLPIFTRELDKASTWSIDNGVKTVVTTSLMMSLAGYNFMIPDMIGGNAYGNYPDQELFIRWTQANALLPTMQFSLLPWHYKNDSLVLLVKKFVDLHAEHADTIIELAKKTLEGGEPIIRAMWWAEPDDPRAHKIGDQFMLGDNLLVAPVLEKGQIERKVYLPSGSWIDVYGQVHTGPGEILVKAPLEVLPYFKRKNSDN